MINLDPIDFFVKKINAVIASFTVIGLVFLVLGLGIIFVPQIIQYLFVIGFVVLGLFSFVIALKLWHVKDLVTRFEIQVGKRIKDLVK